MPFADQLGRPLRSLRISVTDRCNLRCQYCMPEEEYIWLRREQLLRFEEIQSLVAVFAELGVDKVRLTGGEPLVRRDLPVLIRMLAENSKIKDFALTTNGVLLAEFAEPLRSAGLHRITISLDTLRPERFRALSRRDSLTQILEGIEAAARAGFEAVKLDSVVVRGINEDELPDLIEYGKRFGAEVRFIEYMDVGGATHWSRDKVFTRAEMLDRLSRHFGAIAPVREASSAPAERFTLQDGTIFGIIASTTAPFCRACDRSRLTADGIWYLCLYATAGTDLRQALRAGASREDLIALISGAWRQRNDRGAEERLGIPNRGPLVSNNALRQDPHLEMHTRGG
jgi:cyclic pyranopterin phosphate synthase